MVVTLLRGCGAHRRRRGHLRYVALVATLFTLRTSGAAELELPVDAALAARDFIQQFSADRERLTSKSVFKRQKPLLESSCTPPESLPYRLAQLFDQHPDLKKEEAAARKAARRRARAEGQDPDALPKITVSNVVVTPIRLSCDNGLAHGLYAAQLSFDTTIEVALQSVQGDKVISGLTRTTIHHQSHIESELRYGQPSGLSAMYSISRSKTESRFDDPEFDKLMRKSNEEASRNISEPIISAYYTSSGNQATFTFVKIPRPSKGGKTIWVEVLQSTFEYDLDESRSRIETYHGSQLISQATLRDDKLHGEKISYTANFYKPLKIPLAQVSGMENSREVTVDGQDLIETRLCYRNGEQIKVVPCMEN